MSLHIANPNPVPLLLSFVVKNGRNIASAGFPDFSPWSSAIAQIIKPVFTLSSTDVAKKQHICSFFGLKESLVQSEM